MSIKEFDKVIEKILLTEDEIQNRVKELGEQITRDYQDDPDDLVVIGILRGAVIFMADLVKRIDKPVLMDFMAVSSYGDSAKSTGVVRIVKDLENDITGKNILVVEDIIDTGLTLRYIGENMRERGAKSVRIATLLDKPDRRKVNVKVDYVGFQIPDEFVIGYGLDYAQEYRNHPAIAILKREVYEK